MGLEYSRYDTVPDTINDPAVRNKLINDWNPEEISNSCVNSLQHTNESTLLEADLRKAGICLADFLAQKNIQLNVLEIMAGNRVASDIIFDCIEPHIKTWITTDIVNYPSDSKLPFYQLHTVDAVAQYGKQSNILLMISPMPFCYDHKAKYADYYACYDFIESGGFEINL